MPSTTVKRSFSRIRRRLIFDGGDIRIFVFNIAPGQSHRGCTRGLRRWFCCVGGRGIFQGENGRVAPALPGNVAYFGPKELYEMRAQKNGLRVLAVIAPPEAA